jgi:hypothetical protein
VRTVQLCCFETKLPNLMLKIRPIQYFGPLSLDIALSDLFGITLCCSYFVNFLPAGLKLVKVKIKVYECNNVWTNTTFHDAQVPHFHHVTYEWAQ